jgi:hypothetical protein
MWNRFVARLLAPVSASQPRPETFGERLGESSGVLRHDAMAGAVARRQAARTWRPTRRVLGCRSHPVGRAAKSVSGVTARQ